jgi:DNA-binding NarL/FixJ family response regulator
MPGMSGIEVARTLKNEGIRIPILVISSHEDKQFILGMLENGAAGYLVKEEVPDAVLRAVRGIAAGQRGWVSRRVAALLGLWLNGENPGYLNLSESDLTMLRYLITGMRSDQISQELGISLSDLDRRMQRAIRIVREHLK